MKNNWNLRLLSNKPILIDGITVHSPLVRDIADVGEDTYGKLVTILTSPKRLLREDEIDASDYDVLIELSLQHSHILKDVLEGLKFVTHMDFELTKIDGRFVFVHQTPTGKDAGVMHILNSENYKRFKEAIMFSNLLVSKGESSEDEELSDEIQEMIERGMAIKAQLNNSNDMDIQFADIVSAVANMDGNGLNISTVWDLNKYTLMEQFQRGQMKERYLLDIQQLQTASMLGADTKNIKIEHYIRSTLDERND